MKRHEWSAFTLIGVLLSGLIGCSAPPGGTSKEQPMRYEVRHLKEPVNVDGRWDKEPWRSVEPLELTRFMGQRPEHFPKVQAKLAYDANNIYVIFRVEDRYVRAVARKHQDSVCKDSCVEFFFIPGENPDKGYFNLEMNCGGTMLFNYQLVPRKNGVPVSGQDLSLIAVAHSQAKTVEPELADPTTWTVEYRLPFEVIARYFPNPITPAPGVKWRANLYKCGDATSHPHWLTWSPVDCPRPDFHVPESFGGLVFQ